jgi:hypothetical protein
MALLYMDGFDHYGGDITKMNSGLWAIASNGGGGGLTTTHHRTGPYSYQLVNSGTLRQALPAIYSTPVGCGYTIWMDTLPGSTPINAFLYGDRNGAFNIFVQILPTGAISVGIFGRGPGGSLGNIAISSPVLTAGAWQHIECRAKTHETAGEVEVRVNGVTALSVSGVQTHGGGACLAEDALIQTSSDAGAGTPTFFVDDYFIWDTLGSFNNDFLGDRRVITDVPNQDTGIADWAKSTGVNGYSLINDLPPDDDTTYISSPIYVAPGDQSAFLYPPTPANTSMISAVQVIARGFKTDAGPANTKSSILSGAFEGIGSEKTLTSQWTSRFDIFETDPATGAPWTKAALDAASIAIRRTA